MAWLARPGGHLIWWERHGRGDLPALWLHGGPGSGVRAQQAELFDSACYDLVLFDQRGAGRSQPAARDGLAALEANTTADLIDDIEALRGEIGAEAWVVGGGSWGSTLALAYAQAHPDRVRALVLAGVATSARDDLHWLYGDVGAFFPEAHHAFCAHVGVFGDTAACIAAYDARLRGPEAQAAADAWVTWELAIFDQHWDDMPDSPWADPGFRLGFARLCAHYFAAGCFMDDLQIEQGMGAMAHIPGTMIHSRFDPSAPLRGPWRLSRLWPAATLEVLDGRDHTALSAAMAPRIRAATDRLAGRL
ncbi:MAG: alpha/beta fold hydrolase [Pseudomonadota bacterium]